MTTAAIPVVTEQSNPLTQDLDIAGARGIVRLLRQTDSQIFSGWKTFDSVNDKPFLDNLEALCQAIYTHIKHKANKPVLAVITGAGTSGRLAFFCARSLNKLSERYNMNIEFRYLVAGNDLALIKSQEAAEDDTFQAVADLRNLINSKPYAHIIFIGVTCGLSAPYVGSQINWIMNTPEVDQQCTTILMGFNDPNAARNIPLEGWIRNGTTPLGPASENEQVPTMRSIVTELASRVGSGRHFLVTPVLGPEAVTGSSRMKGGTATKMLIEIIFAYSMQLSNNIPLLPDELPNGRRNIPHLLQSFERTARSTYIAEEDLGRVIQLAGDALKNNGHVFYLGEDSISILGLTDASECPPTYGARFDDIRGFVSGGWSIFGNRSGNLSHIDSCYKISDRDFLAYHAPQLTSNDVLIVLYAQGQSAENLHNIIEKTVSQTPVNVVLLCWRHQTKSTHFSSALANLRTHAKVVVDFQLPSFDLALQLPALLEISVKWALNAISTGAHVLKGKVWRNRMIDLTISNNKLYYRSAQIVADVAGVDLEFATTCLLKSIHGVDEVTDEIRQLPVSKQYEIAFPKKKVVPLAILLASKQFVTVDSAKRALEEDPIVRNTLLKIVKQ